MLASLEPYATIGIVLLLVTGLSLVILILAHTVGPKRRGPVKDSPYESGMPVIGDTQRRFNVRYYIVAMLFLLFDVEVVFMWPWVKAYFSAAREDATFPVEPLAHPAGAGFLLIGMGIFFALLLFGLLYEWKRGALEWE